jgi:hypothetical protein
MFRARQKLAKKHFHPSNMNFLACLTSEQMQITTVLLIQLNFETLELLGKDQHFP